MDAAHEVAHLGWCPCHSSNMAYTAADYSTRSASNADDCIQSFKLYTSAWSLRMNHMSDDSCFSGKLQGVADQKHVQTCRAATASAFLCAASTRCLSASLRLRLNSWDQARLRCSSAMQICQDSSRRSEISGVGRSGFSQPSGMLCQPQ